MSEHFQKQAMNMGTLNKEIQDIIARKSVEKETQEELPVSRRSVQPMTRVHSSIEKADSMSKMDKDMAYVINRIEDILGG